MTHAQSLGLAADNSVKMSLLVHIIIRTDIIMGMGAKVDLERIT